MNIIERIKGFYMRRFASYEDYARHIGVRLGKGCYLSTRNFPAEPYLIEIGKQEENHTGKRKKYCYNYRMRCFYKNHISRQKNSYCIVCNPTQ